MITILMATYNGEKYIREQLESIQKQSLTEWKLLIRDDGSTDRTLEIIEEFRNGVSQEVIVKTNIPPSGSAKKNFAKLLMDAVEIEADYIMCCDQDDIWHKDKLKNTMEAMKTMEADDTQKMPLLVHGDVCVVDEGGNKIADSMFSLSHIPVSPSLAELLIQNNVTGCTMLVNKTLVQKIAKYAESDKVIMHDYLIALYAAVFGRTQVIQKPLLEYRQHGDNSVGAKDNTSRKYLWKRLKDGKAAYRLAMQTSREQIFYFLDCFGSMMKETGMTEEYELMSGYAALGGKSHFYRINYYRKHKIWKSGLIRRLMQCIWG